MTRGVQRLTLLVALVATPLALAGDREVRVVPTSAAPYAPYAGFAPRTNAGSVDWLLVTPADLVEAFEPLVRHRRDLGLAAEVVTLEEVAGAALLGGGDVAERLRNLVRRLHDAYGLRYLVLGADANRLPSRMVPFPIRGEKVHYGELYAGDAYFGCLDGEWNADADSRFGEAEQGDDDAPDTRHEVHVGRVPAESVQEVEAFVRKLLLYERPLHTDYQDRVAYLGGNVFSEDDAHAFYEDLHGRFFEARGFRPSYFTRVADGVRPAQVLEALSKGVGVVCHYHHSFTYNLSLPSGAIDTGNVAEIRNAERPFVVFSNGCYANQFTKEGISEKLVLSPVGGAVAFLGSTNTCFTTSLGLERAFWEVLLAGRPRTIGEALSLVRGDVGQSFGVMAFLRLSFNLLGDPAMRLWRSLPQRVTPRVATTESGLTVVLPTPAPPGLQVACSQSGAWGASPFVVPFPERTLRVELPLAVGNGNPYRVTVFGETVVPATVEVPDPGTIRVVGARVEGGVLLVDLEGTDDLRVEVPSDLRPGPWLLEEEVGERALRLFVPVLDGTDVGLVRGDEELRFPGLARMRGADSGGLPLLLGGDARVVEAPGGGGTQAELDVSVESTHDTLRLGWEGERGALWLVEREEDDHRRLLTPVPLVNPVFELEGLEPLSRLRLVLSRLGHEGETIVDAGTTFAFQAGFPQRVGANTTSVQVVDVDGRRGLEVLFGDDKLGLWALRANGSEVRHAGDAWTFGLFAAIESGVHEPVLADLVGSRRPEILATSKLKDRRLYAFDRQGEPVPGFPVAFRSRLMTPPLVGDFDGKRGNEVLVVSGFGKTVELVRPDGTKEPFAEIGQYNYAYPIAANLDRDRALEVVILDGAGTLWVLDQGGKPMPGFPVELGGPGRATPMLADLDRDRGLEIVVVAKGTTRLAVVDVRTGAVQADLTIPAAGKPANHSFFYPGLAQFDAKGPPSIVVGTPSHKLYAFDLVDGKELVVRKGFPVALPAEARGVASVDVDGDGSDELFLSLHDGQVWGLDAGGASLAGFPLRTGADTYAVPTVADLDGDGDLELFLGAADGLLRVWDLPYEGAGRRPATWPGLLGGAGMPGRPGTRGRR